jgi:hypothetical protein
LEPTETQIPVGLPLLAFLVRLVANTKKHPQLWIYSDRPDVSSPVGWFSLSPPLWIKVCYSFCLLGLQPQNAFHNFVRSLPEVLCISKPLNMLPPQRADGRMSCVLLPNRRGSLHGSASVLTFGMCGVLEYGKVLMKT